LAQFGRLMLIERTYLDRFFVDGSRSTSTFHRRTRALASGYLRSRWMSQDHPSA
jgi:hypothetical protein